MQRINGIAEHLFDRLNVVQHAVIGTLCNRQHTRFLIRSVSRKGVRFNLLTNRLWVELALRNWADNAVVVARRHQEDRNRTTHNDGVQNRLVTVTVYDHDIAGCYC